MLVSRLLFRLLRFTMLHAAPDDGVGGAAPVAPPAEPTAAAPAPVADTPAAPTPGPAEPPADPFAGLTSALDAVGTDPAATPAAPAQPRVAGKFASAAQRAAGISATPAPTAAPVAGPAAPMQPAPKPGEIDLTPPEGITERAKERWGQLTERAKLVPVLEQRATEAASALDSVRRMVTDSGLAPQEFTEMLEMSRLARSQNPQDAQRALQMLDAQRAQLATRLGIDAPGVDVLAAHPDLKQKVDGMLLTREDALEIVRLRNGEQQTQRQTQQTQQAQQEHAQFVQTVNNAAATMDRTLASLAGTPGHEAKMGYIKQHLGNPQNLQAFVSTYQPHQWAPAMLAMYHAYTAPPAAPALPQPLRPGHGNHGGPVRSGPVTAESSVMNAFAKAGL